MYICMVFWSGGQRRRGRGGWRDRPASGGTPFIIKPYTLRRPGGCRSAIVQEALSFFTVPNEGIRKGGSDQQTILMSHSLGRNSNDNSNNDNNSVGNSNSNNDNNNNNNNYYYYLNNHYDYYYSSNTNANTYYYSPGAAGTLRTSSSPRSWRSSWRTLKGYIPGVYCVCIYIYIYIYIEREREREMHVRQTTLH